jgi:hypothetical protein
LFRPDGRGRKKGEKNKGHRPGRQVVHSSFTVDRISADRRYSYRAPFSLMGKDGRQGRCWSQGKKDSGRLDHPLDGVAIGCEELQATPRKISG